MRVYKKSYLKFSCVQLRLITLYTHTEKNRNFIKRVGMMINCYVLRISRMKIVSNKLKHSFAHVKPIPEHPYVVNITLHVFYSSAIR